MGAASAGAALGGGGGGGGNVTAVNVASAIGACAEASVGTSTTFGGGEPVTKWPSAHELTIVATMTAALLDRTEAPASSHAGRKLLLRLLR